MLAVNSLLQTGSRRNGTRHWRGPWHWPGWCPCSVPRLHGHDRELLQPSRATRMDPRGGGNSFGRLSRCTPLAAGWSRRRRAARCAAGRMPQLRAPTPSSPVALGAVAAPSLGSGARSALGDSSNSCGKRLGRTLLRACCCRRRTGRRSRRRERPPAGRPRSSESSGRSSRRQSRSLWCCHSTERLGGRARAWGSSRRRAFDSPRNIARRLARSSPPRACWSRRHTGPARWPRPGAGASRCQRPADPR
mmetsp:Transcript_19705/g.62463  ORF Transcript_19705/g.62463 Transcript_19705/m.62463 type:complete len:248 (+) Transcript_19705:808-1551(+)